MTNVIKFGRKVLTMGTVFSTILWSVGVSALVPAMAQAQTSCPAFQPGDMIKVSGRPAIYSVDANGKVLYFPSGDEFKSWNAGETYGGYTTVSQSCFDSLPVPTMAPLGVNFRPGSYVVKRPSSDQLYVVEPNNTLAPITASAASALYGASYKVKTVADVFWPNYGNTRGAAVTEAKAHPGMLVSNGGKTYFVDSTGALREVTAAGFTANRFKTAFVHPIASTAGYTMGTLISAFEASASDRTQTGATGGSTTTTGGAVTVSLASDNPAGGILASGTSFNPVLKLNLTAGSQAVSVTGLTIRKSGFANNQAVNGIDVVDSQGVRHGNVASSLTADNDVTLLFAGAPIVVNAGSTQTVTVRVSLGTDTSAKSGTLQFSVVGASAVQGAAAGGSFPVTGNVFTLQDGSNAIGGAAVTSKLVNTAGTSLNVDTTNEQDIAKFDISAVSNTNENVRLTKLTVYNNGTAADSDVQDVQLVGQDGTVLATSQQVGKNVVFNLVSPYVIDKGTSKTVTVRAKIVSGVGRTIQFVIYNAYDVVLNGANTGVSILPSTTDNSSQFPVGSNASNNPNNVVIASGTLSFNKDISSPSTAVTPGAQTVVLAKYYAKPTGEDMELRKITMQIVTSTGLISDVLTGSITIKVNGSAVYSGTPSDFGAAKTVNLSTYPTMTAGQNSYITVEGNIPSLAANGRTIQVKLAVAEVRRLIANAIDTLTTDPVAANAIAIQGAGLQVTILATPVTQSVVIGTNGVTLANVEFNAGAKTSGEDIKVSRVVFTDVRASSASNTDLSNLALYNSSGAQLATALMVSTTPNTSTLTFNLNPAITVPKTGSFVVTLKGDVSSGTGSHTFSVKAAGDVTAIGASTGNSVVSPNLAVSGSGQALSIVDSGTMTLSVVSGSMGAPSANQALVVGLTKVPVFAVKLSSQKEGMKVTSLKLTASGTSLSVNDVTNLKLSLNADGSSPFATAGQMTASTTANTLTYTWTAADNVLPAAVQPGTPVTIYVTADVGGAGVAKLGDDFKFSIAASGDVMAKGASSGTDYTVTNTAVASGISYITPFTVNVAAAYPSSDITANLTNGSRIGTFKITNMGSSQITLTSIKITDLTGGAHSGVTYSLKASSQNSSDFSAADLGAITLGTAKTTFGTNTTTIDGGAFKYVTVYTASGTPATDSWQLSITSIGDVKFTAAETELGYDANVDNTLSATADSAVFQAVAADKATAGQISDTTSA